MERVNIEIINSVCEKLGAALNDITEIKRLHGKEVCKLESMLVSALGLLKSKEIKFTSEEFEQHIYFFVKDCEKELHTINQGVADGKKINVRQGLAGTVQPKLGN